MRGAGEITWRIRLMRRIQAPRGYLMLRIGHFLHGKRGNPPVSRRRAELMRSVMPLRTGVTRYLTGLPERLRLGPDEADEHPPSGGSWPGAARRRRARRRRARRRRAQRGGGGRYWVAGMR